MLSFIDQYFGITEKGSTLRTELLAGVSTFLVLSYIFVVNPAILSQAGLDRSSVLFATILVSGLCTLAMGLWARLPFVLAPGMEMNAYVAYFVVGTLGLSWQQALGTVFWSGVLFVLVSATRFRQKVIDAVPPAMKMSLSLCVAVFLALIALRIAGVLKYDGVHVSGIGALLGKPALVLYLGFVVAFLLDRLNVRAAVLLSVMASAGVAYAIGVQSGDKAANVSLGMFSAVGAMDVSVVLRPAALGVILVLFLIDFYGSVAKLIGLTANTSIQEDGSVPRLNRALLVDSVGTTAAAFTGTSNITVYVESGVGIGAGGRTGLTAVACGVLMLSCFAVAPFLHLIPRVATTGALLFVAEKIRQTAAREGAWNVVDILSATAMIVTVIASFALDRAMLAGLVVHAGESAFRRRTVNRYQLASIVLLTVGVWFQLRR